jgi:hypothetical protein
MRTHPAVVDDRSVHNPFEKDRPMDFWDFFRLMVISIPIVMVWAAALVDVFRRGDLGGIGKALWTVTVFVLPVVGTLIYLITRPALYLTTRPAGDPLPSMADIEPVRA